MVKVNMDKEGTIRSFFDNSFSISTSLSMDFPNEQLVEAYCTENDIQASQLQNEDILFFTGNDMVPAVKLHIKKGAEVNYEVVLNNEGKEIYRHDLIMYFDSPPADSTVTAMVFMPDPLTTANVTYGAPYNDQGDIDVTELNDERALVNMTVDYNAGTFTLSSPWCLITEHSSPNVPPVTSSDPDTFSFTRAEQGFEDVNVYYHINVFQNHIQNLGFTNLVNYAIECDVHGLNGADNSLFNPGPPGTLTFGEGGVDDAEDADVVLHEYGHAVTNSAAPGTNTGLERNALDEATGDYIASSYSRFLDPYKWENVFSWDGHNEFWAGRSSISTKQYPNDLTGNLYTDADIWSSTIMQIWGDIGRDLADEILFESIFSYASNMTMADAAQLYIQADTLLYNGANYPWICNRFKNRGLITVGCPPLSISEKHTASDIRLLNSMGFAFSNEAATVILPAAGTALIQLYNIEGRLLRSDEISNRESIIISPEGLAGGTYLLQVTTPQETTAFKLVKLY